MIVTVTKGSKCIKKEFSSVGEAIAFINSCGSDMFCPTPLAPDRAKRAAKSNPSASKRSKSGAAGKANRWAESPICLKSGAW